MAGVLIDGIFRKEHPVGITERRAEELVNGFCVNNEHLRYLIEKSELKPVIIALLDPFSKLRKAAPRCLRFRQQYTFINTTSPRSHAVRTGNTL